MDERGRTEADTRTEIPREVSIMEFEGDFVVDGTPDEVWPYFNDPDILQDCAPGCEELILESPSRLRATLSVSVGSVKPTFDVTAVVVECDGPNRLELRASGEASRNSFEVSAWQELSANGDGTTTVMWGANAQVSGIIASLGERALESVTRKLVDDFFTDIEEHITAGTPAEAKLEAVEEVDEVAAERLAPADEPIPGAPLDVGGDNVGRYVIAGVAVGALAALLWARFRRRRASTGTDDDSDAEADAESDADSEADADSAVTPSAGGGRLRYLFAGIVIGVVGKVLWDQYTGEDAIETTAPHVDTGADVSTRETEATELSEAATERETEAADAEGEARAADADTAREETEADATEDVDAGGEGDDQEGMIDDPLDRLR